MNSFQNKYDSIESLIFNEGLKISSVNFSSSLDKMYIHLNNDLTFIIQTELFPTLKSASKSNLNNFKLIAGATGIYWPDLDEEIGRAHV